MTPVRYHEPAYPLCVHWAGRGLRPLDPRNGDTAALRRLRPRRRCGRRRVAGRQDHERRSEPRRPTAHGRPRPSSRCAPPPLALRPLQGDCRGRPCGKLLRASRKAGPLSTPGTAASGEPLRCRGAPTRRRQAPAHRSCRRQRPVHVATARMGRPCGSSASC